MPNIVVFTQQNPPPEYDFPHPDRLVSGNPQRITWNHYTNEGGEFSCGIWECATGCWNIRFAAGKEEFFCVISGQVRLHGKDGAAVDIGPGEAAVIPANFEGRFEVLQPVRKYYVIYAKPLAD